MIISKNGEVKIICKNGAEEYYDDVAAVITSFIAISKQEPNPMKDEDIEKTLMEMIVNCFHQKSKFLDVTELFKSVLDKKNDKGELDD